MTNSIQLEQTHPSNDSEDAEKTPEATGFDTEFLLLIPIISLAAVYAYRARTYDFDAKLFPQVTAVLVLFLSGLVIVQKLNRGAVLRARERLPGFQTLGTASGLRNLLRNAIYTVNVTLQSNTGFTVASSFVLIVLTIYLEGLLITAPVFTLVYLFKFGFSKITSVAVSVAVFCYIYAVMNLLNLERFLGGVFF